MTQAELALIVRGIAPILAAQISIGVQKAVAGFSDRITAMELRVASLKDGADGKPGEPGRDADSSALSELQADVATLKTNLERLRSEWPDVDWITSLVDSKVAAAVAALPVPALHEVRQLADAIKDLPTPKDGAPGVPGPAGPKGDPGERGPEGLQGTPGRDGRDGDRGLQGDKGIDGKDGVAGRDGVAGKDGRDGIDGQDGAPGLDGKDGAPGLDGKDGASGLDGKDGAPGLHGKDGATGPDGLMGPQGLPGDRGEKGIDGVHGRDGRDGAQGLPGLQGEKGLDGRDGVNGLNGKDGLDGLGFDDFDMRFEPTRGVVLGLYQGDRSKEFVCPQPFFLPDWAPGTIVPKGGGVQWDGGYWIALQETHLSPAENLKEWRLLVRRGKQGREGKQGKDGSPGKDLTSFDPATGRKW